jgi:dihydroflavonol-4-reductase
MTSVVTGASGHVGANLLPELLEAGHSVRALVRDDVRALDGLDVEPVRGSIMEPDDLDRAFAGARRVFHLAGRISIVGDPDGAVRRTNVDGVRNVVEACERAGVERLVHVSSIHARAVQPLDEPVDESRAPAESGPAYDRSKAAGEAEVRAGVERGLDAVIVAPTGVIGPRDFKPSRAGQMILAVAGRTLPALVEGGFNWVDVRDVSRSIRLAADRGTAGRSYLLPGAWHRIADVAAMVGREVGVAAPRWVPSMGLARLGAPFVQAWGWMTSSEPIYTAEALHALRTHRHVVGERAMRELGHTARPIEETVADSVAWFRRAGYLE